MKNLILSILLVVTLTGCGTLGLFTQGVDESGQPTVTVSPVIAGPLKAIKRSPIPYAEPLAGVALSLLSGFAYLKQRKMRKVAKQLIDDVDTAIDLVGTGTAATIKAELIKNQRKAGVKADIASLRES